MPSTFPPVYSTGNPVAVGVVVRKIMAATDGVTVDQSGLAYRGDGIVVALPQYGAILPAEVSDPANRAMMIESWVRYRAVEVAGPHARPRYYGARVDGGKLYLDVVEVFSREDRDAAVAAGRSRNQIAVWDAGRGEEVPTDGDGMVTDLGY